MPDGASTGRCEATARGGGEDVLAELDRCAGPGASRSAYIERLLRRHFRRRARAVEQARDLAILNGSADRLNADMAEVLEFQAPWSDDEQGGRPMRRGDLFRVRHPSGDAKRARVFVVVSRTVLVRAAFSTLICAPVMTHGEGLTTQVPVGTDEGLKHESWILCDGLTSIEKARLTDFVGSLSAPKLRALERALRSALELG